MNTEFYYSPSEMGFLDMSGESLADEKLAGEDAGGGFAVTQGEEGSPSFTRRKEKKEENSEWLEMVGRFIRSIDIDEL